MSQKVKLEINDPKGFFYIENDGEIQAKMSFVYAGAKKIIIDHTEVNEDQNGKGFGNDLLLEAISYAREKDLTIVPLCPFVKHVFDKTPEFKDVL
jgi:predicted GNAT family acetyltransferase